MCRKTPKFQCYCCPNAVCAKCISSAEFVHVRNDNGFCSECLELILLGEQDEAYDSDGVCIMRLSSFCHKYMVTIFPALYFVLGLKDVNYPIVLPMLSIMI